MNKKGLTLSVLLCLSLATMALATSALDLSEVPFPDLTETDLWKNQSNDIKVEITSFKIWKYIDNGIWKLVSDSEEAISSEDYVPPLNLSEVPFPDLTETDLWKNQSNDIKVEITPVENPIDYKYEYYLTVTLPRNAKYAYRAYASLQFEPGTHTVTFHVTYENPHDKWNTLVGWNYFMEPDPTDMLEVGVNLTPDEWNPPYLVVERETALINAQTITVTFTALKAGTINFFLECHSIITDINGDGKVGIQDIYLIAGVYGKYLAYGIYDPDYDKDMDCDFRIIHRDLNLIAADFGKTIPP